MNPGGIDVNAFPPELPPEPAGDDLEPEAAPDAPTAAAEGSEASQHQAAVEGAQDGPQWPPCEFCNGPSQLAIRYRSGGETEFSCFPCHGVMIARALNEAADAETAAPA